MSFVTFPGMPIFIMLGVIALVCFAVICGPDDSRAKYCFATIAYMIVSYVVAGLSALWFPPDFILATSPLNAFFEILHTLV